MSQGKLLTHTGAASLTADHYGGKPGKKGPKGDKGDKGDTGAKGDKVGPPHLVNCVLNLCWD